MTTAGSFALEPIPNPVKSVHDEQVVEPNKPATQTQNSATKIALAYTFTGKRERPVPCSIMRTPPYQAATPITRHQNQLRLRERYTKGMAVSKSKALILLAFHFPSLRSNKVVIQTFGYQSTQLLPCGGVI